jgi:hypothetical protein
MQRFIPLLLITILLAAIGLVATPPTASAQDSDISRGEVRPDAGAPGTVFRFFATGFQGIDLDDEDEDEPGEKEIVSVWINAPDGSVTTDGIQRVNEVTASGRVDWRWVSPEDAQQGLWSAVAYGNDSGNEVVILFEIDENAEPVPQDPDRLDNNVQPNAAPGGTEFAFYATGFDAEEDFNVWVNTPAGEALDIQGEELYETNASGRADWLWTAPTDAQPGYWSMVVRGEESGLEQVIPFEITR